MTLEDNATHGVIMADSPRLQQVLWNLLKNANQFTPSGGQIIVGFANEPSN